MGGLVMNELSRRKVSVVVVEIKKESEDGLRASKVPYILGDATEEATLMHAGLMRARAMVVALASDADSVYITLTAHALRPDLNIIARAEHPSTEAKLKRAGATRVVCPQETGALKIANVITRPTVVDFVELAVRGLELEIDEYLIGAGSPLVGQALRESPLRRGTNATVVAIKRADGKAIFSPDPDAVLSAGDTLILVGPAGISGRLANI
jgi:voltage-gated potassium channel